MTNRKRQILVLAVLAAVFGAHQLVFATEEAGVSEVITAQVRLNCSQIKVRLKQLKINDALTRVNYGQAFESISQNVIVPVNNRLVANSYKPIGLLEISDQYDRAITNFRQSYVAYEERLSNLIAADCQQNPGEFYKELAKIRLLRQKSAVYIQELIKATENYNVKFKEMMNEIQDLN